MSKNTIDYNHFVGVEIRIGRITEAQPFPRARNPSYKVAVDFAEHGVKWSSAQITGYTLDELPGRLVVCVVNMPPRNIAGFQSEILILGAHDDQGQVILLTPEREVVVGGEVS